MGLLDRFEAKVDSLVNGAFARAFKAEVQPVEIAGALQREMDDRAAIVSQGRTVIPNLFVVELSGHDFDRLGVYQDTLQAELSGMVREYAEEQRYTFLGGVEVTLRRDDELDTGIFRVRSEARADVVAQPSPTTPAAPPTGAGHPRLVVDDTSYPLTRAVTRLGRGSDVDIRIDDPSVSRHHAEVVLGQPPVVRDVGSTNGTLVNGERVSEAALADGATIRLGGVTLVFRTG